jgi:hypothetical protein
MDDGLIGKKVKIILIGKYYYTGIVKDEGDMFYTILDKFGHTVMISKDQIEVLEVLNGN